MISAGICKRWLSRNEVSDKSLAISEKSGNAQAPILLAFVVIFPSDEFLGSTGLSDVLTASRAAAGR